MDWVTLCEYDEWWFVAYECNMISVWCMYGMIHWLKMVNSDMVLEWKFIGGWL